MADSKQLRRLVDYNQWADERVLSAIDGLGTDELERPREAYFQTIAANLRHTLIAQRNWLARWQGQPRGDQTIGDSWREAYATTHAALRSFVGGLSDADADRVVRFTDLQGHPREVVLADAIIHVVNHGTAHRAETGLLLERLGRSPGDLDYTLYRREHP